MDLLERRVMDARFGFPEFLKNGGGAFASLRGELRIAQDFENRAERTMLLLIFGFYAHIRGGHAIFPDLFGRQLPAGDLQPAQIGAELLEIAAGIDERAESHVSADA